MSYQSISVKEAMGLVNGDVNGWFLPVVQRPYVWGSRYESELYICKLFDSLLRGYPIGGLILWNTAEEIPYREFMKDYEIDVNPQRFVDKGLWKRKDKWLVYDGQQRLQTLHSCLKYTFNNKILVFNLLFDLKKKDIDPDETGFLFVEKNAGILPNYIRMNELFSKLPEEKVKYRREIFGKCDGLSDDGKNLIEENVDELWDVFVKTDKKSLAYFPISYKDESMVNEIFQRLNMGGVSLSQADLLFSRIKETYYDFEEKLQDYSRKIFNHTDKGYLFDAYNILQLIYLILNDSVRVDPKKVNKEALTGFNETWGKLEAPLHAFFGDFIWGQLKINNNSIIPKKLALLPIMVYFYLSYEKGINFKKITQENILLLKQYLILSQINDWNLQSIVDNFTRILKESIKKTDEFPLNQFISWLNETKKRNTELFEVSFVDYHWFSLKILTPNRIYQFDPDARGRYNPEIDHIFPKNLKGQTEEYYKAVNRIWNMQPVKGDINNFKRRKHPKEFFSSDKGKKYIKDYDFLPSLNLKDEIWDNPVEFINQRKEKMMEYFKSEYRLEMKLQTAHNP
ncbi:MAG: DUF262 domain-containing protein [Halobacteriota archaeon]